MKNFERFTSSVTCESDCFQSLLTANFISSSKAWCIIKMVLAIIFTYYFIILFPVRSPRFLFRLYAIIGSFSNAVNRLEFISNKCQCLLIICFTFGNVLLYVINVLKYVINVLQIFDRFS